MTDSQSVESNKNDDSIAWTEGTTSNYSRNKISNFHNNNNNHNNNKNIEEPKYLHKKFKKMANRNSHRIFEAVNESNISLIEHKKFELDEISSKFDVKLKNLDESSYSHKFHYTCPYCKLSYAKSSILQKHIQAHLSYDERSYLCMACRFSLKSKANLCQLCSSKTHFCKVEDGNTIKLSEDCNVNLDNTSDDCSTQVLRTSLPSYTEMQSIVSQVCCATSYFNSISNSACTSRSTVNISRSEDRSIDFSITKSLVDNNIYTNAALNCGKIYKPKFHTFLQQLEISKPPKSQSTNEQFNEHIENMINEKSIMEPNYLHPQKILYRQKSLEPEKLSMFQDSVITSPRKRCHSENLDTHDFNLNRTSNSLKNSDHSLNYIRQSDLSASVKINYQKQHRGNIDFKLASEICEDIPLALQPMASPGPLLGNTRLISTRTFQSDIKRTRYEFSTDEHSVNKFSDYSRAKALQMFGGEVKVLDKIGEKQIMRIESISNSSTDVTVTTKSNENSGPETSVVVRSTLHSGGTILHKTKKEIADFSLNNSAQVEVSLNYAKPNIASPTLAPTVSCLKYSKPSKILLEGQFVPYVPGMPGPHNLPVSVKPLDLALSTSSSKELFNFRDCKNIPFICMNFSTDSGSLTNTYSANKVEKTTSSAGSRFLRPSSLALKPGTFKPKQHHGITPTKNTLPLISPETPRSKKSYGQLYLNGHAYTYLGLKCSTRLFYCTLNRPQPMYVIQQHSLSMYSNWKVCDEKPCEVQLADYDSRQRPTTFTLACPRQDDILTHSSQYLNIIKHSTDNIKNDNQDKNKRIKIFDGGFESNEDYTYVRGRGRGRYVCEECGIRCKKPSMLKKHIRTHTDVRPYTCKYCAFSFKTKGNLTKHMKSKSHYKKCMDLKVLPVPIIVCDENIDKEALSRLSLAGVTIDETSSEEEESEAEESEESGSEEQEAAQSLLSLSQASLQRLPGLLPKTRPSTYPYCLNVLVSESDNRNEDSCNRNDCQSFTSFVSTNLNPLNSDSYYLKYRQSFLVSCKDSLTDTVLSNFGNITLNSCTSISDISTKKKVMTVPIDLTTKINQTNSQAHSNCTNTLNVLANVTGTSLLNSIAQTIEKLPKFKYKDQEWQSKDSAKNLMLQAYLTERYVMDRKLKQQYYVGTDETRRENKFSSLVSTIKKPIIDSEFFNGSDNCAHDKCDDKGKDNCQSEKLIKNSYNLRKEVPKIRINELTDAVTSCALASNKNASKYQNPDEDNRFRPTLIQNTDCTKKLSKFLQPSVSEGSKFSSLLDDGRSTCSICNKVFSKPSQLRLHINIHYFERPFRCESCGTSFRTKGHLVKHERSTLHHNKVSMTSAFGTPTASNPRPFKCIDCKSAFRIHGHLAKHLRSKMHIMKLECLHKLPFGTYAEMERSGFNFNDIDTTDCDTSLTSLQIMAQKLYEKDPGKLGHWEFGVPNLTNSGSETSSDETEVDQATQNINPVTRENLSVLIAEDAYKATLEDVETDEVENMQLYECQRCSKSMKSLNELHIHYFIEHNSETSPKSKTYLSQNEKIQIKKKA